MIKAVHSKRDKIILICDRIIEYCLYLVIFTSTFSKAAVESFFSLAFSAYIFKKLLSFSANSRQPLFPSTKLDFPILAFICANVISVMASQNFIVSAKSFLTVIVENIGFYLMTLEIILFQKKNKKHFFIEVILLTSALIVFDAAFQYFTGKDIFRRFVMSSQRLTASLGSPNTFGAWLVLVTPLFCCWSIMGKIKNLILRRGSIILSFLLILCIFLTYSRGTWLGFLVGALFIAAFKDKRIILFFLILVTFFSALILVYPSSVPAFNIGYGKYSVLIRFNIWKEALGLIKDYPFFGVGLKNYLAMIPKYQIHAFKNMSVDEIGESTGISPHNGYLQITAETGLIGLGCFLWLLWTLFKNGIRYLRRDPDPVLLGLLSGLIAFSVSAFFDNHLNKIGLSAMFWIMLALAASFLKKPRPHSLPGRSWAGNQL